MASALDKLKEKISQLQNAYFTLKRENEALKKRIEEAEGQLLECKNGDIKEIETLKSLLKEKEKKIVELQNEMVEKDAEIGAIIKKVETLLEELGDY